MKLLFCHSGSFCVTVERRLIANTVKKTKYRLFLFSPRYYHEEGPNGPYNMERSGIVAAETKPRRQHIIPLKKDSMKQTMSESKFKKGRGEKKKNQHQERKKEDRSAMWSIIWAIE